MRRLEQKHPLAIRWFHWINFPVLFLMIWSGLLIYWADAVYRLGLGKYTLFTFFPDRVFAINGLVYVVYTVLSGEWRYLVPNRHSFREAIQVVLHDLRLRKIGPPPRKFNGAQQIAYTTVILMGAGSLVTGIAIYKPVQFAWLTALLGGYPWARWEHFWLAAGYVLFFVIHLLQVLRAGWNNFRAMVTGYEVVTVSGPSSSGKSNSSIPADITTHDEKTP